MTIHTSGSETKINLKLTPTTNLLPFLGTVYRDGIVSVTMEGKKTKKLNEIDTEIDTSQQIYSFRLVFMSLFCYTSPFLLYTIIYKIVYRLLMTILMMTQLKYDTWSLIIMRHNNSKVRHKCSPLSRQQSAGFQLYFNSDKTKELANVSSCHHLHYSYLFFESE